MKPNFLRLKKLFFSEEMDLRVKIFNVLAMAGVVNCILMVALGLVIGSSSANLFFNLGTGILSAGLLIYSAKSGRYQFCYTVTIGVIFLVFFLHQSTNFLSNMHQNLKSLFHTFHS